MACFYLLVRTHSNTFVDKLLFRPLTGRKIFFSPLLCVISKGQKYVSFFLQNWLNLSYFRSIRVIKNIYDVYWRWVIWICSVYMYIYTLFVVTKTCTMAFSNCYIILKWVKFKCQFCIKSKNACVKLHVYMIWS